MNRKQLQPLADSKLQHVCDGFTLVPYIQGCFVEALAVAFFAAHVHCRKEVHFDATYAVALAAFAATTLYVEAEAAGGVRMRARFRKQCKETTNFVEHFNVGGGVAAWGATDGFLIDGDHFVEMVNAVDAAMSTDAAR